MTSVNRVQTTVLRGIANCGEPEKHAKIGHLFHAGMTMDGRRGFFAIPAVMIAFSLFSHGWMVWRGYIEDGPL